MPVWWNWTSRSVWSRPEENTWWHVGDLGCATWISDNEPDGWTRTCWGELGMHSKEWNGLNLQDGSQHLLDLRFADDILLGEATSHSLVQLLDILIDCLDSVGLSLNASKTIILTKKTQPPNLLRTRRGEQITVLDSMGSHKWLGCMLTSKGSKSSNIDIGYHLQATKALYANKAVLCDKHVSICKWRLYFHTIVTPVACLGAGPRAIHGVDLSKLDVHFGNW